MNVNFIPCQFKYNDYVPIYHKLPNLSFLLQLLFAYSDAHTTKAIQWYKILNEHALPHLICITHGDRLYADSKMHKQMDEADTNRAIQMEIKVHKYYFARSNFHYYMSQTIEEKVNQASDSLMQTLGIFSLKMDNDSPLKTPEGQQRIRDAGIKGIEDVGTWIVESLEEHLKEVKTAQLLKHYFKLV